MNSAGVSDAEVFKAYQRINKVLAGIGRGINSKTAHSDLLGCLNIVVSEPTLFQKVADEIFEVEFNNFDDSYKL